MGCVTVKYGVAIAPSKDVWEFDLRMFPYVVSESVIPMRDVCVPA